jgi:hypothetical protein
MTNDEIIQGLYRGDSRAIKEAIKVLEQETCEDAISKASVFEIMGNLMSIPYECDRQITEKGVSESMDEVRELPPVTPTRKKGKWIKEMSWLGWDGCSYQCSECGRSIHLDTEVEDLIDYPYCHCGVEMGIEEETESEE